MAQPPGGINAVHTSPKAFSIIWKAPAAFTRATSKRILVISPVGSPARNCSAAEQIRLTDKAGQVVRMNAAPGQESISATDKSGSLVFMDGVAGNIIIRSTNTVLINT